MISKKLTSKVGITIPKALRADLGWQPSMAVDLTDRTLIYADSAVLINQ